MLCLPIQAVPRLGFARTKCLFHTCGLRGLAGDGLAGVPRGRQQAVPRNFAVCGPGAGQGDALGVVRVGGGPPQAHAHAARLARRQALSVPVLRAVLGLGRVRGSVGARGAGLLLTVLLRERAWRLRAGLLHVYFTGESSLVYTAGRTRARVVRPERPVFERGTSAGGPAQSFVSSERAPQEGCERGAHAGRGVRASAGRCIQSACGHQPASGRVLCAQPCGPGVQPC